MSRSVHLSFVLIVALSAVQSAVVRENNVDGMFREGRASTITKTVTSTAATPSTTVISTKLVCAILVNPVATSACRRKKQYWGVPLFYPFGQFDMQQFDTFNPTQVLGVQPSVMPEFRNRPSWQSDSAISQFSYPFDIQPSIEGTADGAAPVQTMFRIADPFFFAPLSSLVSNIVSNMLTPPVTVTSTETVYTTTVTSSSFTATAKYTLSAIACLPAQVKICPADPVIVAGAPLQAAAPVLSAPAVTSSVAATPVVVATPAATTLAATTPAATTPAATTPAPTTPAATTPAATTPAPTTPAATTPAATTPVATTPAATTPAATTPAATTPAATTPAATTSRTTTTAPAA